MRDFMDITVLLDRSGSMQAIANDVIGGFNNFVKEQAEIGENASITLIQFDTYNNKMDLTRTPTLPVKEVKPLTSSTFQPRGYTPLRDAIGTVITETGARFAVLEEDERPDKVIFLIMTDGHENASEEFSRVQIKEMIQHQTDVYNWNFIFLGANQDSFTEAASIGINVTNVSNYTNATAGVAYAVTSGNIERYRGSGDAASLAYSKGQRDTLGKG